jgi:hypothetical protein
MQSSDIYTTRFSHEFIALCGMGLGAVAIISSAIVAITIVMAIYYRKTLRDEMEATLKIEMIERNMSAEDIERVLKAKMGSAEFKARAHLFGASAARGQKLGPQAKQA